MKISFIVLNFLFSIILSALQCGAAESRSIVFVSILPQKYFVQQISGDRFAVEVMVPPGASPHTYEPKPSQMRKLAASLAYFTIGVELERVWLDKIATINPDMHVFHTDAAIEKIAMAGEPHSHFADVAEDVHRDEDETGLDPHIWLSPALVKSQAGIIRDSLIQLDPAGEHVYRENFAAFAARLDNLDDRLRQLLEDQQHRKFMVFHPSWGYFAASYGLEQVAVEIEGKQPKPAQLKALIRQARELDITVVFAQPQLSQKSAEVIAREIGGEVVLIDPLAENWFENMSQVADKFSRAAR